MVAHSESHQRWDAVGEILRAATDELLLSAEGGTRRFGMWYVNPPHCATTQRGLEMAQIVIRYCA